MAGFTDALRRDWLYKANRALDRLESDPQLLDRAIRCFSDSPPANPSNLFGLTTRHESPVAPREEHRRNQEQINREEQRCQLRNECGASFPRQQFSDQASDEKTRLWNADPEVNWLGRQSIGSIHDKIAHANIKKRWVEQGIWKSEWNEMADGRWKHENPLQLESESETDTELDSPSRRLFILGRQSPPKPKRPKSDDEKQRIAQRRVVREREREASCPYYQFVYQISKERELIKESANKEGTDTVDINTRAYEHVKNTWSRRGIWNRRWGILPGMLWKHEENLEELLEELLEDEAADGPFTFSETPPRNAQLLVSHESEASPTSRLSRSPSPNEPRRVASTNSSTPEFQSRPVRDVASNMATRSSVRPLGILKRPRTKTAKRHSRKNKKDVHLC